MKLVKKRGFQYLIMVITFASALVISGVLTKSKKTEVTKQVTRKKTSPKPTKKQEKPKTQPVATASATQRWIDF
ncbi:MAG: hypothetical protein AAFO69_08185 [Bacteroidota bacterium]